MGGAECGAAWRRVADAAHAVADVAGMQADARATLEDAYLLARAFPMQEDYLSAVANTVRALCQLVAGDVLPSRLKHDHLGWFSYHYRHKVAQGARADMRIVFRREGDCIRLRAFGRRNPQGVIYARIALES